MLSNAKLKFLRSLSRKKVRAENRQFLVEGLNAVEEAVAAGLARELYLEADLDSARANAILAHGVPSIEIDAADVKELTQTQTPTGAFALVDDPCAPYREFALAESALFLLAAGVADPGNLGTLIRTAAALGVDGVICAPNTVEPLNPKVVRATAGALFRVPVLSGTVEEVRESGCALFVADASGEPLAKVADRPARVALVVGNEPRGVDAAVRLAADKTVAVELARGVESLNVAVAAGILLHGLAAMAVSAS
ncbi:MAG: RNA methyltransferase [Planctomycetota bacterium]